MKKALNYFIILVISLFSIIDTVFSEEVTLNYNQSMPNEIVSNSPECITSDFSCVTAAGSPTSLANTYKCKITAQNKDCEATVTAGAKVYQIQVGNNLQNEESDNNGITTSGNENNNVGSLTCDYILGEDYNNPEYLSYYIVRLLNLIKILGPILVVIMTIIDLVKFIALGKSDELNKLAAKSLKRIIYAVLLFVIPTILDTLFKLFSIYGVCLPEEEMLTYVFYTKCTWFNC